LKREVTSDLIEEISAEEISAENFPVGAGMLDEVERRLDDYSRDPSKVTTLGEIEAGSAIGRTVLEVVFLLAAEVDVQGACGWFEGRREGRRALNFAASPGTRSVARE
jgi:hypothetical protein